MSTPRQVELFRKLTEDRKFPPGSNLPGLKAQFADLTDANASAWIENALALPKLGEGETGPMVPAPF